MIELLPVTESDAAELTNIAMESKQSWGYDDAFMTQCVDELTQSPEKINLPSTYFYAAYKEQKIVGFYCVISEENLRCELDALFISPTAFSLGIGSLLLNHAIQESKSRGEAFMDIVSDPNAVSFYQKHGANFVKLIPSESVPGRELPLMCIEL